MAEVSTRYQQLADEFATLIHQGKIKAGQRLPAIRRVAQTHQVSVNTVLSAWQRLENRGLVEARPQSGFYVRSVLAEVAASAPKQLKPRQLGREKMALIEAAFSAQRNPAYTNISLACPQHEDFFPTAKLAKISASLLRRKPDIISTYALPNNGEPLREQIAKRTLYSGLSISAEEIIITHGCSEAIQLALRVITSPGDCIGIESPTYFFLFPLLAELGLKAVEIPTDPRTGIKMDVLELMLKEKRISALLTIPTVHNPLGFTTSVADKKRLAHLAQQYKLPIIEDGIYSELQFQSPPSPAIKSFDKEGWVIYCTSFTKTLAPDFRIGWMMAGRFHEAVSRLKGLSTLGESALLTNTLAEFLANGGYDHHLRSLRRRYASNMDKVRDMISRYFPEGTQATRPTGGFVFWAELPGEINTVDLFEQLLNERICVTPGSLYSLSDHYHHALRLSCCYPFDERYRYALRRTGELACEMTGIAAQEYQTPGLTTAVENSGEP
ncbi:PLP-dependent aminotransferase family protein [Tatumella sp. TA1]|uniref:aminotransferase-like domain-containing protein n=1 Tax=Rosenbergiella collisarenosi TaxID=1544695 RepID=UPI0008F93950|nr:PLP-dependent aminotransferase family protein [Rosenbergiella collisarenosi]MBT0721999.1 PLP-dependent aminotransferase family protein [Rosenbergiella collisarenosi]QGX92815.1 PLP-dependent aminotransferase family protein [Tatumella sp. TA1]